MAPMDAAAVAPPSREAGKVQKAGKRALMPDTREREHQHAERNAVARPHTPR